MKQQARTKPIRVHYKGYTLVQVPWKSIDRGMQYAKYLFDKEHSEILHTGYSGYCSHKELRLMIREEVNELLPLLRGRE